MLSSIWFTFLYQPVFNVLIILYGTIGGQNLGWAVVWLTICLRILLLPLTIVSELNALKHKKAVSEAEGAIVAYKNDRIAQKEVTRKIMRKYHISPWAKVSVLLVQAIVLVLLYQVFIRGISGEKITKILYSFVDFPGKINTVFYGVEIGEPHNVIWAGAAALYLFVSIFFQNRKRASWEKADALFLFAFPLFTFAVLWYLPMVKSLFILTSMLFSDIISIPRRLLFSSKKTK